MAGRLIRTDGKEDTLFEHELEGLDWLNPASGKFEGRKGEKLYDELMEAYENRIPVSVDDLWLMENDARRAILTPAGGAAMPLKQEAAQTETPAVVAEVSTPEALLSASAPSQEEEAVLCPACGNPLRARVRFCGKCGHGLEGEGAEMPQAEAEGAEMAVEQCPECGHSLKPGTQFCGGCGHRLVEGVQQVSDTAAEEPVQEEAPQAELSPEEMLARACPECGRATEPDWVVCPFCGKALKDQ